MKLLGFLQDDESSTDLPNKKKKGKEKEKGQIKSNVDVTRKVNKDSLQKNLKRKSDGSSSQSFDSVNEGMDAKFLVYLLVISRVLRLYVEFASFLILLWYNGRKSIKKRSIDSSSILTLTVVGDSRLKMINYYDSQRIMGFMGSRYFLKILLLKLLY